MVKSMKLYNALGVAADANEDQIKKAYKKAALKWHPDRNPNNKEEAELKFKDVSEAYETLSDPKMRRIYDQVGEDYKNAAAGGGGGAPGGFPGGFPAGGFSSGDGTTFHFTSGGGGGGDPRKIFQQFFGAGFDPTSSSYDDEDPFSQLFGGGGGGFSFGGMPGMQGMQSMGRGGGRPKGKPKGATKEFKLDCTLEELSTGCTKKRKLTRKRLQGGMYVDAPKVLEITVAPGWKSGTKVTFSGEGDEAQQQAPGDIVFVVNQVPHKDFVREDSNLIYKPKLKAGDTHTIAVPLLTGPPLNIRVPSGAASVPVPDKGMPIRKGGKSVGHGDIIIKPTWS
ncbi:Protein psi1 [Diplonema papillatum]|nr:Protein psi1 [Diplonema papillatum]